jgi:isopentenyldiphosphate isomerase
MLDPVEEVDEQDKPTGRLLERAAVCGGDSKAIHRCIAVYVFDSGGGLYVQTHKKSGLFDHSVGGHVDAGEDYVIAAKREAEEELGISGVPFHEIATGVLSREPTRRHMFGVYECFPAKDWQFVPNDEVDTITCMTMEQVVDTVNNRPERFTSGFINVLKFYIQRKQLPFEIVVDGETRPWES